MSEPDVHVLDNAPWHALTGPQRTVAEGSGQARRYQPAVAPFAALPDVATAAAWADLARLVGRGGAPLVLRAEVTPPVGWEVLFEVRGVQMVLERDGAGSVPADAGARDLAAGDLPDVEVLGGSDVDEILALVARTRPGPFAARTLELGTYLGMRVDGALVAMAGERMRCLGYTEVSAVCTDTAFRGRGLARALVRSVTAGIVARDEVPFLHAAAANTAAIALYESLGFTLRRTVTGVALRAPGAGPAANRGR